MRLFTNNERSRKREQYVKAYNKYNFIQNQCKYI